MKLCKTCKKEFKVIYNHQLYCSSECQKLFRKQYMKEFRQNNKLEIQKYNKEYHQQHIKELREKENKYRQEWYKNSANKLKKSLRVRIYQALKGQWKSEHTIELLGCTIKKLKYHLEKQFKVGMSWSNYGKWHVDHILPCASFNLTNAKEQKLCFNYKNLQPLWALENILKSDTI
jgi:hypothetical protein